VNNTRVKVATGLLEEMHDFRAIHEIARKSTMNSYVRLNGRPWHVYFSQTIKHSEKQEEKYKTIIDVSFFC